MKAQMRNLETNELAPVHEIGVDEDLHPILARVDGWELIGVDEEDYCCDEDGNYVLLS